MTLSDRDRTYIEHMLCCIARINDYTAREKSRFIHEPMVQDAVLRVLQTMAESSQRLSAEVKNSHPEINWRGIIGFRNILVHDYLGGIDLELVWQVVDVELPAMQQSLVQLQ